MLISAASITVLLVINWINYHRYRWFCILCFTYDMLKHIWFDDAYFENRNVWLFLSDPGVPGFLFCRMLKIEMFYYSFFSSAECQRWSKRMGRGQVGDDVIQNLNHKIENEKTKSYQAGQWPICGFVWWYSKSINHQIFSIFNRQCPLFMFQVPLCHRVGW